MADERLTIFVSYARANDRFVDRLDADLRARGYKTWVDRRKLEASQDWLAEIDAAIVRCNLFLINLSPEAVASKYVRHEFEEAQRREKPLMPVLYDNCTIPAWMSAVDAVERQDFTKGEYALNLKKLLYAIQYPSLPRGASTGQLYDEALQSRGSEPERAAVLLQHIVDTNPTYFNGRPQRDLAELEAQLYPTHIALLGRSAVEARQKGQYGAEAALLKKLIDLGDRDAAAYEWAKEYLAVAEVNREMLEPYDNAQNALDRGDISTARELLRDVWRAAPRFRDPAGIAPKLDLEEEIPPSYEQAKAADAERERLKRAYAALEVCFEGLRRRFPGVYKTVADPLDRPSEGHDPRIGRWTAFDGVDVGDSRSAEPASDFSSDADGHDPQTRWLQTGPLLHAYQDADTNWGAYVTRPLFAEPALDFRFEAVSSSLRRENYDLTQPAAQEALRRLVEHLHTSKSLAESALEEPPSLMVLHGGFEYIGDTASAVSEALPGCGGCVGLLIGVAVLVGAISAAVSLGYGNVLRWVGISVSALLAALFLAFVITVILSLLNKRRAARLDEAAVSEFKQADAAYKQWRQLAEQTLQERIAAINRGGA